MTHCWAKEPNKRPHFRSLFNQLDAFNRSSSSSGGFPKNGATTSATTAMVFTEEAANAARADNISVEMEGSIESDNDIADSESGAAAHKVAELSVYSDIGTSGVSNMGYMDTEQNPVTKVEMSDIDSHSNRRVSDADSATHTREDTESIKSLDDESPVGQF